MEGKIDAYIKENPKYWNYLQAMPRDRLERTVVLNEVRQIERQQRMREGIMKRINDDPKLKSAYELLVKDAAGLRPARGGHDPNGTAEATYRGPLRSNKRANPRCYLRLIYVGSWSGSGNGSRPALGRAKSNFITQWKTLKPRH